MHKTVHALFHYTRAKITDQDIRDFLPGDPSYSAYLGLWTKIHRSGMVPEKTEFNLSEVINLTGWTHAETESDPARFLAFRRFTSAVGVMLLHHGNRSESVRPAVHLARDLITDLDHEDSKHLKLLREVFPPTRDVLAATRYEKEYPFFTLGMMILAQIAQDWEGSAEAATRFIADEVSVRNHESKSRWREGGRFLLYPADYEGWIELAHRLTNPKNDENTQLIIDAFANMSPKG